MRFNLYPSLFLSVVVITLSTCAGIFIKDGDYVLGLICIAGAVGAVILFWDIIRTSDTAESIVDIMNGVTEDKLLQGQGQRIKTRLLQELSEHPDLGRHMVKSVFGPDFDIDRGDALDLIIYMVIKRWPGSIQYDWINVRKAIYWTFQVENEMNIIEYIHFQILSEIP